VSRCLAHCVQMLDRCACASKHFVMYLCICVLLFAYTCTKQVCACAYVCILVCLSLLCVGE